MGFTSIFHPDSLLGAHTWSSKENGWQAKGAPPPKSNMKRSVPPPQPATTTTTSNTDKYLETMKELLDRYQKSNIDLDTLRNAAKTTPTVRFEEDVNVNMPTPVPHRTTYRFNSSGDTVPAYEFDEMVDRYMASEDALKGAYAEIDRLKSALERERLRYRHVIDQLNAYKEENEMLRSEALVHGENKTDLSRTLREMRSTLHEYRRRIHELREYIIHTRGEGEEHHHHHHHIPFPDLTPISDDFYDDDEYYPYESEHLSSEDPLFDRPIHAMGPHEYSRRYGPRRSRSESFTSNDYEHHHHHHHPNRYPPTSSRHQRPDMMERGHYPPPHSSSAASSSRYPSMNQNNRPRPSPGVGPGLGPGAHERDPRSNPRDPRDPRDRDPRDPRDPSNRDPRGTPAAHAVPNPSKMPYPHTSNGGNGRPPRTPAQTGQARPPPQGPQQRPPVGSSSIPPPGASPYGPPPNPAGGSGGDPRYNSRSNTMTGPNGRRRTASFSGSGPSSAYDRERARLYSNPGASASASNLGPNGSMRSRGGVGPGGPSAAAAPPPPKAPAGPGRLRRFSDKLVNASDKLANVQIPAPNENSWATKFFDAGHQGRTATGSFRRPAGSETPNQRAYQSTTYGRNPGSRGGAHSRNPSAPPMAGPGHGHGGPPLPPGGPSRTPRQGAMATPQMTPNPGVQSPSIDFKDSDIDSLERLLNEPSSSAGPTAGPGPHATPMMH